MNPFSLTHLADHLLRKDLVSANGARCAADAHELARIAEFDARRLYLPEGYPSMYQFCVSELKYSDDEADTRICVARAAHEFPAIYPMIQDRRLNQTAVLRLALRLNTENTEDLLAAAANRSKAQLALLLAERFPQADLPALVMAIGTAGACAEPVGNAEAPNLGPGCIQPVPERVGRSVPRAKVTPLAPQRFALQFTVGDEAHALLIRAQDLPGHSAPSGDLSELFLRAMRMFVERLEKQRLAATSRPRARRGSPKGRTIPNEVKRAVWERDGGQCTFVSERGHRCEERSGLELDHVIPVARGGEATEGNLRLRCRAHNQHEADRVFGKGFMDEKRREARRQAAEAKAQKAAADAARSRERAAAEAELAATSDVIPGLKILGCRGDDLRYAAHLVAAIPDASTKERMHCAIKGLGRASMSRLTHASRAPV
jgi:5-methylcytosine-specific restriction endonuclease McrA